MNSYDSSLEEDGFAVSPKCLTQRTIEQLRLSLGDFKYAQRNLLDVPAVRDLATSEPVRQLANAILGDKCFAVRGLLFNKTPDANWKVAWHQDRTIAVRQRKDISHFGPWSIKAGVPHVQPPSSVIENMLAIRLHLDASDENNGPLRVIPGSRKPGCLSREEITMWANRSSVMCTVPQGGAIVMRPLLVHASSSCLKPLARRVIHLEFAVDEPPEGLEWHDRV